MKLKPLKANEYRYAVLIREGQRLWLTLLVRRSPKGDFFVFVPRPGFDSKWTPHASYHPDGTHHMKSHNQPTMIRQGQPLTGEFKHGESLVCFAGHSPGLEPYDANLFSDAVVVEPGLLTPMHGAVCVDLVEPGCEPITALPYHRIVKRQVITNTVPHVVVTIYSPGDLQGNSQ